MAIDNLNYYSAWLPAGQQTDRYSSQPWCLRSKNLDIFSSSKSVKATAFSTPSQWDSDIIKEEWGLVLKTDWKVYERTALGDVLFVDPSVNFPVYKVSYTWENWPFNDAEWGTVQDMSVAVEWDEWKSFVVYTDRASYVYSKVKYTPAKSFGGDTDRLVIQWGGDPYQYWYFFRKSGSSASASLWIIVDNPQFTTIPIRLYATESSSTDSHISLDSYTTYDPKWYYYDAELDAMTPTATLHSIQEIPVSWDILQWFTFNAPSFPVYNSSRRMISLNFKWTKVEWSSTTSWSGWELYVDINWWPSADHRISLTWGGKSDWDYNDYYTYLPIRERKLQDIGEYYWMKWQSFQPLYDRESSWVDVNGEKKTRYDFTMYSWWANDPWMDVIWLISWNEQVYMIGNMDWNGYIIPCDLSWGRWTPYIAYGCEFKWVTNIDYLLYLVGENRWISCLWVYNWQELVPVIWGREEKDSKNLIKNEEQYKFDWKIVNWRKNLIFTTEDNRIFQYWQTFGGKGWVFIHELPSEATITWLKANWNDLEIDYSITESWTTTNYSITYQDDTPIKNYNIEWMAEYPIVIWNHLLEKEESDLFVSYILPSSACKLEFWGMANHYHFRTFTSSDSYTFSTEASYKMKWCTGNYALKFIEKNDNQYTFRLEWDLPVQNWNDMKITDTEWTELINYSEYNHFRKIGEITTIEYQEWEFRFHNLNNKLELPKSHSLQIMVKGKGNQNYTPELFALDLVANQRERW